MVACRRVPAFNVSVGAWIVCGLVFSCTSLTLSRDEQAMQVRTSASPPSPCQPGVSSTVAYCEISIPTALPAAELPSISVALSETLQAKVDTADRCSSAAHFNMDGKTVRSRSEDSFTD